jgi:hypothetical protein
VIESSLVCAAEERMMPTGVAGGTAEKYGEEPTQSDNTRSDRTRPSRTSHMKQATQK